MDGRKAVSAALATLLLSAPVIGCTQHKGPAQRAGEKVDNAVEETGDAAKKAGNKVGGAAKKAGDKIEDATDK